MERFTELGFQTGRDIEAISVAVVNAISEEGDANNTCGILGNPTEKLGVLAVPQEQVTVETNIPTNKVDTNAMFFARDDVENQIDHE